MSPSILVEKKTRKRLSNHLRKSGNREIGGILFGEQMAPGRFRLADFSVDSTTGQAAHFCRSVDFHNEQLEKFYQRTGNDYSRYNYLGEWHSHPSFSVSPSSQDYKSMLGLVHSEANIKFSALLIARIDYTLYLELSATMFSRNNIPEDIEVKGF